MLSASPSAESIRSTAFKVVFKSNPVVLRTVRSMSMPVHPNSNSCNPAKSSRTKVSATVKAWVSNCPSTWATSKPANSTVKDN